MKKGHPWRSATLGDVLDIESAAILPEPGVSYRYLGLENIEQNTGRILEAPETDGAAIESQKYVFAPSQVLYGKLRPNLNKVALPDFAGVCSTDILPLAIRLFSPLAGFRPPCCQPGERHKDAALWAAPITAHGD